MGKQPQKTIYTPRYPEKYIGTYPIISRSSWEISMFQFCDLNQDVIEWASEPVKIPYANPVTGKQSIYIPDLLVRFLDQNGRDETFLIEIKPAHEAMQEQVRDSRDAITLAKNQAKWLAAGAWCMRRGINFKIMTEEDLFGTELKKPKRAKKPAKQKKTTSKKTVSRGLK